MESQRIEQKLKLLELYLDEMYQLKPESEKHLTSSLQLKRAVERQFQILIETVLDISFLLANHLNVGIPDDESNIFDLLEPYLKNANKYKLMKGFRNILVHQYGKIDYSIVYQILDENLDDFVQFKDDVEEILKVKKIV